MLKSHRTGDPILYTEETILLIKKKDQKFYFHNHWPISSQQHNVSMRNFFCAQILFLYIIQSINILLAHIISYILFNKQHNSQFLCFHLFHALSKVIILIADFPHSLVRMTHLHLNLSIIKCCSMHSIYCLQCILLSLKFHISKSFRSSLYLVV